MQRELHQDNTLWRIPADRSELALLVLYEVSVLRITLEVNNDGSIVRLAGRLADEFVSEAERVCLSVEAPLLIDATGRAAVTATSRIRLQPAWAGRFYWTKRSAAPKATPGTRATLASASRNSTSLNEPPIGSPFHFLVKTPEKSGKE